MSESLKDIFEELKNEDVIKGEYFNLESYFKLKQNSYSDEDKLRQEEFRADFIKFSEILAREQDKIKQEYFKGEYHTIDKWIRNYILAKEYYKEHGNLETEIGEVYEIHGFRLKIDDWLMRQRNLKNKGLSDSQIILLDEIKMIWNLERRVYKDTLQKQSENKKSA